MHLLGKNGSLRNLKGFARADQNGAAPGLSAVAHSSPVKGGILRRRSSPCRGWELRAKLNSRIEGSWKGRDPFE